MANSVGKPDPQFPAIRMGFHPGDRLDQGVGRHKSIGIEQEHMVPCNQGHSLVFGTAKADVYVVEDDDNLLCQPRDLIA